MGGLELSLEILVHGVNVTHFVIDQVFIGDLKGDQELGGVSLTLEIGKARGEPPKDVLERSLLSVNDVSAEVGVEVGGVSEHLEESTHAFLCLICGLFRGVYRLVGVVKVAEDFVNDFNHLHGRLIVELHHTEVTHEGRSVEHVYGVLDLSGVERGCLGEGPRSGGTCLRVEHLVLTEVLLVLHIA